MKIFFAGSEVPSHRKVLRENGAKNAALSFMGLRRRIKHPDKWLLSEKFPDGMGLLLDSGAFTVNKDAMAYTQADLKTIAEDYKEFVEANWERVDMFIEFDALALGREWIEDERDVWKDFTGLEKFLPVWHPEWGVNYLQEMAEEFPNIGIPTVDLSGRNLTPVLNHIASNGVKIHGVAMTHMDDMRDIKWHSVSSTSWVAPQQYGETHVWTGRELKRYPKKMKDQARKRYRTLFEREGFDVEKIESDDSTELLRLSIWSWETFVADIDSRAQRGLHVVTSLPEEGEDGFTELDEVEVDTLPDETRNNVTTLPVPVVRTPIPIPVLGVTTETVVDEATGEETEIRTVKVRSESERRCDNCFLSQKCPAFEPNSNCAFNIPLQIRTRSEFQTALNSFIEMQAQRVLFMRYAEELEGGYADPNLSAELDRLTKMMKNKAELEREGISIKFEANQVGPGTGGAGVLSRLFGEQASQRAQELPSPMTVEQVQDVIEGDLE